MKAALRELTHFRLIDMPVVGAVLVAVWRWC